MRFLIPVALAGAIAVPSLAQTAATVAPAIADYSASVPINGSWSYAATAGGGESRLLDAAMRPQLFITCDRSTRRVMVAKPASAAAPYLQFWTTSATRTVPASFDPTTARLRAVFAANDSLLDAMALSRGRMAVGVAGQPAVVAPVWAEIGRVVEECRV